MKTILIFFVFITSSPTWAQISQGSICISPERFSVARGTKTMVFLDRSTNSEGNMVWRSGYSGTFEAGFFSGVIAVAKSAKRQIILNQTELNKLETRHFLSPEGQNQVLNAFKIDFNNDCTTR